MRHLNNFKSIQEDLQILAIKTKQTVKPFRKCLKIVFIGLLLTGLNTPLPTDDFLRSRDYDPASQIFYDQKFK